MSDPFLKRTKELNGREDLCVALYYGGNRELNLVFDYVEEMHEFVTGLQHFIKKDLEEEEKEEHVVDDWQRFAQNIFLEVDVNNDRRLDLNEINVLINRLNLNVKKDSVKKLFHELDNDNSGFLEFNEFLQLLQSIR